MGVFFLFIKYTFLMSDSNTLYIFAPHMIGTYDFFMIFNFILINLIRFIILRGSRNVWMLTKKIKLFSFEIFNLFGRVKWPMSDFLLWTYFIKCYKFNKKSVRKHS
jgi:hypothetical protein